MDGRLDAGWARTVRARSGAAKLKLADVSQELHRLYERTRGSPPPLESEMMLFGSRLHLGRIAEESMSLDVTGHYNRPDLFEFRLRRP